MKSSGLTNDKHGWSLVGAGCVLYLLVAIAVFAPVLAGDRPLFVNARLHGILAHHLKSLERAYPYDVKNKVPGVAKDLDRTLRRLQVHLAPGDAVRVDAFLVEWSALVRTSAPADRRLAFLTRVHEELRNAKPRKVLLLPALADLGWVQTFLMALVLVAPFTGAGRWFRGGRFGIQRTDLVWVVLAGALTAAPCFLNPVEVLDFKADQGTLLEADPGASLVFPPIPFCPDQADSEARLLPPLRSAASGDRHWLGTDDLGRDISSLLIWGTRTSLMVGLASVALLLAIGMGLGALAGYLRGAVDLVISRVIEVFQAFPSLILILAAVAFLESNLVVIILVIGLTRWTTAARLMRGEVLRVCRLEFVAAARTLGLSTPRILVRHILPNAVGPVLVHAVFAVAAAVLLESSLAFLGLGDPGQVSWGQVIDRGRGFIEAWWITVFPGAILFTTLLALRMVGEGIRSSAGPRYAS